MTIGTSYLRVQRCSRAVRDFADLAEDQVGATPCLRLALTLTYAPGNEWAAYHLTEFIERVRAYCARRGWWFMYLAVAELQQRGAVHYHILLWLPAGAWLPKPDKRGWWPHGLTQTARARRAVPYMAKYVSKLESKTGRFPRGLRLYSSGGLTRGRRLWCAWLRLPRYVRERWKPECDVTRVSGGFVAREIGEFMKSRWRLDSHAPDWTWVRFVERDDGEDEAGAEDRVP